MLSRHACIPALRGVYMYSFSTSCMLLILKTVQEGEKAGTEDEHLPAVVD